MLKDAKRKEQERLAEDLYRQQSSCMLQFLGRRVPTCQDAHDLWHETFLQFLRIRDARLIEDPQGYLYAIASRLLWKFHQRRRTADVCSCAGPDAFQQMQALAGRAGPEEAADVAALSARAEEELRRMPHHERAAVIYCRFQGRTYKEAARMMGKSVYQVERYLAAGMARLSLIRPRA
jgi:RNA polymerase sigma factor (sigma-70 family)